MDGLVAEISFRSESLHNVAQKYMFLTPSNLLDKKFRCDVDAFYENIRKKDFLVERAKLQNYLAVADAKDMEESL